MRSAVRGLSTNTAFVRKGVVVADHCDAREEIS